MKYRLIDYLFFFVAIPLQKKIRRLEFETKRLKTVQQADSQLKVSFQVKEAREKAQQSALREQIRIQNHVLAVFIKKDPKLAKVIDKELEKLKRENDRLRSKAS